VAESKALGCGARGSCRLGNS